MYRIIDDRGTGKTSQLMLLAKENNAKFVCASPRAMETKAHGYGIVGIEFMSYFDFVHSKGEDIGPYVVDEFESLEKYFQGTYCGQGELIGYTLSKE